MKDKYNIMSFKNILTDFLDFNNAYKVFMLLSLSGSKLNGGVYGGRYTPPGIIYPLNSRYIIQGCGGRGVHPLTKFQTTKVQ
jgi:hypothetical protein